MQYSTLTILLVDEDPGGVQALQRMLSPVSDMQFKLAHVQELKKGLLWLSKAPIDVVLLDLPAGDDRKLQGIREINSVAPKVPVIVLAAFVAFDADMRILQSGAQDVMVKAEMTAAGLTRAIRYALARAAYSQSPRSPAAEDGKPETQPATIAPAAAEVAPVSTDAPPPAEPTSVAGSSHEGEKVPAPEPAVAVETNVDTADQPATVDSSEASPVAASTESEADQLPVAAPDPTVVAAADDDDPDPAPAPPQFDSPEAAAPEAPIGDEFPVQAETAVGREVPVEQDVSADHDVPVADPVVAEHSTQVDTADRVEPPIIEETAPEVAPDPVAVDEFVGVDPTLAVADETVPAAVEERPEDGFQAYAPTSDAGAMGFGSALDKILQTPAEPEPDAESTSPAGVVDTPPKPPQFVFPTSDPLSERKDDDSEKANESTAPRALSDTVEKDYQNLVDMAEQIFEAARAGTEPDSASVIDAIWRTLEQLRKNDELLEESVRQRRDYHSWSQRGANVAVLSIRLGVEVDCDERRCLALGLCGLMHDLGMLTIPKDVLDSPRFNASQLKQLRQHPLESQKMIEKFGESFAWVGKIVAQAHERQDGGGYPRGLKGNQIHEVANILGLADTYEAMSHPRPDRKARATYDALKEIVDRRNYQFDRRIIKALISIVSIFPLGSLVQLSNGEVGRVVRVSRNFPTRPSVEIILDPQGKTVNYTRFVVLENEPLLTIVDPAIPEDVLRR